MNVEFIDKGKLKIAHIISDNIEIHNTQDALDLLMNFRYQDAEAMIIYEHNLIPAFFDLKTKIAGDILQKFSTYQSKLSIIGNFEKYKSHSLHDFILESNKSGRINFVSTLNEAIQSLV